MIFQPSPTHKSFNNIVGLKFGRLTIIGYFGTCKTGSGWYCECECGNIIMASHLAITGGGVKSCGCLFNETRRCSLKHNHANNGNVTPTWNSWSKLRGRCLNINDKAYPEYGGRGITVCERWLDSFENFLSDMGEKPHGLTIDRIDNNGNYEPGNCRWANKTQQSNNRRNNIVLTHNGVSMTLSEWADSCGIRYATIRLRIKNGWDIGRAISVPVDSKYHHKSSSIKNFGN